MVNDLLAYMKGVVEGQDNLPPFARWLHENEPQLQQLCNRGSFLRLKSEPIPEFRRILTEHNVSFVESSAAYLPAAAGDYSWVQTSWLTERLFPYRQSPTNLAREMGVYLDELLHMIHIKETGDELWRFQTPEATWANKHGQAGIALVRGDRVVYAIVIKRN